MSLGTAITASIGGDTGPLQAAAGRVEAITNRITGLLGKIGAGLSVAGGAAAFFALGKGALELAGRLKDTSDNLNINVESLQALESLHKRNGVASEQFGAALAKMKNNVFEAAEGNQANAKALGALGLSAERMLGLPLDQQYAAIAAAATSARNPTEAFNAVSVLFGERVGPRLMGSLRELAEEGLPKVTAQAKEAGHVMSTETVAALDRAGDAIEDFKKQATIAVGNILVNFRTEEGMQLLWAQFERVVTSFGLGVLDAIKEANDMVRAGLGGAFDWILSKFRDGWVSSIAFMAEQVNRILPKGFEIDVKAIELLKSAGKSISDQITDAIAKTAPSTFKKDYQEVQDRHIAGLKSAAEAAAKELESGLKKGGAAVVDSGHKAADPIVTKAAPAIVSAGAAAAGAIAAAAKQAQLVVEADAAVRKGAGAGLTDDEQAKLRAWIQGDRKGPEPVFTRSGMEFTTSAAFGSASDGAIKEIIRRISNELPGLDKGSAFDFGQSMRISELTARRAAAQRELDLRESIRSDVGFLGVEGARRQFTGDPMVFDKLVAQFTTQQEKVDETNRLLEAVRKETQGVSAQIQDLKIRR